ncbi:hypothetical protein EJ04DRAFT_177062 [Polyplosphaeria fusca]|uniref:Uncharacterized protein n=1 Tax=Polyplosphaeria fusca TaxID=682080 RepID=A0A9P4R3J7_9PLEO|nr:hypothetical protein EJ04DRAFT_177062 [Polyplosphaeria fusca]
MRGRAVLRSAVLTDRSDSFVELSRSALFFLRSCILVRVPALPCAELSSKAPFHIRRLRLKRPISSKDLDIRVDPEHHGINHGHGLDTRSSSANSSRGWNARTCAIRARRPVPRLGIHVVEWCVGCQAHVARKLSCFRSLALTLFIPYSSQPQRPRDSSCPSISRFWI